MWIPGTFQLLVLFLTTDLFIICFISLPFGFMCGHIAEFVDGVAVTSGSGLTSAMPKITLAHVL
jgi:hypothetical protein